MTSRAMSATAAPAGRFSTHKGIPLAAIRSNWASFRLWLVRASARRRLARSIGHLDDRLLADVGLAPHDRGLGDRLIRHFVPHSRR
jgi:uncharacterized protein YjiS (DUF1127 family)